MEHKGQGTIEYLVIIAIVIVIALVVVGLLLQVMNSGSGVPETQAKATWKSVEPFAIIDWGKSGQELTLVLQNNSGETTGFNNFQLTSDANISAGAANSDANISAKSLATGGTYTITVDTGDDCASGTKFSYPKSGITFDYNSPNINNKTQNAVADIIGTC